MSRIGYLTKKTPSVYANFDFDLSLEKNLGIFMSQVENKNISQIKCIYLQKANGFHTYGLNIQICKRLK